ncbi:MAG TPA: SigE family RNA polymerase sigma factor [Streptosporangiaceae bacterium]|nr:SigE family RNA polymerase sigma factor [Streptosporangiaceae bacterium]
MNGQEDEFARFVEARERTLQRTAWMLTGDWALAEDLVQTALAKAWLRWERITRRDDPEIYVRRAMLNTWLTWRRRRWHSEKASAELPDSAAPGDLAAEIAARETVRQVLTRLTDKQRAVLVLRVVDDLSEAQVAQVLNCAVGTVKSTMSQALAKLRGDQRLVELMEAERR